MKKNITCIICPRGCTVTAEINGDQITVTGNACQRGKNHAIGELTNPVRSLTSVIRVSNRVDTMVSVKSAAPIPKDKMFEIIGLIHETTAKAPIKVGDILISDICGTDIVATKEVL